MKFINPKVEYWPQQSGLQGVWHQIARATRVCYQSLPKEGETDEEFVKRIILKPAQRKDGSYDLNKMHGACLEQGTVYLEVDGLKLDKKEAIALRTFYLDNPYSKVTGSAYGIMDITTNMRVIVENNRQYDLCFLCTPTEHHIKRYTFDVITDIGVTRQMNRHRTFSVAEQSTRYCDYTKHKFDGELTFIRPAWWQDIQITDEGIRILKDSYADSELAYQALRHQGWKPEKARQVLPLGIKTEAVYTAFVDDWKHFIALRADNVSGKAHPNIRYVASGIKRIAEEQKLW